MLRLHALLSCSILAHQVVICHGSKYEPDLESAERNAFHIFNAIDSAGRLFGSALKHNGFSFLPAVIPRGTLLYHGDRHDYPPSTPDYLAFEVEHAETFSSSRKLSEAECAKLQSEPAECSLWNSRGYLHTYRASQDLNVLYIDGMAAAKSKYGTLDSQDVVLRQNKTGPWENYMDEGGRATDICNLITPFGYYGFVRTEIGFEAIYCNLTDGLDLMSATRTPVVEHRVGDNELDLFRHARAVSTQYDGLKADRLRIDFSSMVSGFFFPINISATSPKRPDLLRLAAASSDELDSIRAHLLHVLAQPRRFTVDWQSITDLVVARYHARLSFLLAQGIYTENFISEIERTILPYTNAAAMDGDVALDTGKNVNIAQSRSGVQQTLEGTCSPRNQDQQHPWDSGLCARRSVSAAVINRCADHYLLPALLHRALWSPEDELIHHALRTVTHTICETFLNIHNDLLEAIYDLNIAADSGAKLIAFDDILAKAREQLQLLVGRLDWSIWKRVHRCQPDEVEFVAMYPYGTKEDHYNPGCRRWDEMKFPRIGYWDLDYFAAMFPGLDVSGA